MGQEEIIARRYAAGLAGRAAETGGTARARDDLELLAGIVNPRSEGYVAEMADFLASPRFGADEKLAAASAVLGRLGVDGVARDFFGLLVRRGRTALLPRIQEHFNAMAAELEGEFAGVVETAAALTPEQLRGLTRALSGALGRPVRLHQRIEPGLLAGARVTAGGMTFDGSVLGKWRRLRDRLAGCGLPGCEDGGEESKGDRECAKN